MTRVIRLGDGYRVTLSQYIVAWRRVIDAPADTIFKRGLLWAVPTSRAEMLAEFRRGLHDRINRHLPRYAQGRKWDEDWQRETVQAAHHLNTPRLIIDWLPPHLRSRFAHRLRSAQD